MQPLITGANGLLGFELIRQFRAVGVQVIAAVGPVRTELEKARRAELARMGVPMLECDLRRERPLEEVPIRWDTLFHLAAYVRTEERSEEVRINDLGTERLLRQLSLQEKCLVYTSTLAVADSARGRPITRQTTCSPRTAYGVTKLAAEAVVRGASQSAGARHLILRLPTLYGPGYRAGGMFDVLARELWRQRPLARVAWPGRLALLAVEDAAAMLRGAAGLPEAWNQTYVVSSNENPATWEIAEGIASAIGAAYRPIRLPGWVWRILGASVSHGWQSGWVPSKLQVAAWRAELLLRGLYCRGDELLDLTRVVPRDWRQGLRRMYGEDSRWKEGLENVSEGRS